MPVTQANLSALRSAWQQPDSLQSPPLTLPVTACGISYNSTAVVPSKKIAELLWLAAENAGLKQAINDLFAGAHVNISENRPALHMALRDPQPDYGLTPAAINDIHKVRERITTLAENLYKGQLPCGDLITDIIHIGIGGSDLSTRLLTKALGHFAKATPRIHFLSSPASHWPILAEQLNPANTLVIVASKSFDTAETLHNMAMVDNWQNKQGHRIAITANLDAARQHGFDASQILPLWSWVGGRYAFSSAVSLASAISMGAGEFQALLAGAHAMDKHFCSTAIHQNLPVWMALTDFWQHVVGEYPARGVFAYDPKLSQLTNWLQQLETESNGKSVTATGEPLNMPGAPLVFGGDGSDAQHALYQMLHQGQNIWPLEFIGIQPQPDNPTSQLLYAQLQGQAQTFITGDQAATAHSKLAGNRPVSTTLLDQLDAWHMGTLLAAYEHKTYCLATLIGCNPFDQWGVEAGKRASQSALQSFGLCEPKP